MASGLLKYIGRGNDTPPREDDEGLAQRIKARMERMGMVEDEATESPKIPTRGTLNQVSSNRRMVADQARVTHRSLKLTRGITSAPAMPDSRRKASSSSQSVVSRHKESFPGNQDNDRYAGSEGGMFDTDAENLDSTTHIGDVGEEPVPHARFDDGQANVSGNAFEDVSEDESSLPSRSIDNEHRHGYQSNNLKTESIDVELSSSDDAHDSYPESNDDRPQYGSEATQDLLHETRDTAEYFRVAITPDSRQKAIESVLESPSIQKSLAYRSVPGRSKQSKATISSRTDASKPAVKVSAYKMDNEDPRNVANTHDRTRTEELHIKAPIHPGVGGKAVQDASVHTVIDTAFNRQRPQSQQPLRFEPIQSGPDYSVNGTSLEWATSQMDSQKGRKSSQLGLTGQQPLRATNQPTMTVAENNRLEQPDTDPAPVKQQEFSQTFGQTPVVIPKNGLNVQHDVTAHVPTQHTAPDMTTPALMYSGHPQYTDAERAEGPVASNLVIMKDAVIDHHGTTDSRKRNLELDYNTAQLSSMTYKLLNSESFDHIPRGASTALPTNAEDSMIESVQNAYYLSDHAECQLQRQAVFTNLNIEQYEEAGDILLEKFSSVIARYKEARRSKRTVAKELEKEVAQREALVRSKTTAIDDDLTGLRQAGQKVVQGKYS